MGRLIDVDALLQKFNDTGIQITFDLPVEEILGEDVDIDDFAMLVQDAIQVYKEMVIGTIKEQPTAYNLEKVVEELEAYSTTEYIRTTKGLMPIKVVSLEDCKKIVRKGGVE